MQGTMQDRDRSTGHGTGDGGYSLLEVLVCVAILALICIPVMRGFQTSSWYNKEAYETQNATAYLQSVTESVLHQSREAFCQALLAAGGNVTENLDTVQQAKFPETAPGTVYPEELFTVTACRQEDITIAGSGYDLTVVYNPIPYSEKKAGGTVALESGAEDSNVYTSSDISAIDGMKYAVIADEINSYEGTEGTGSAVLYNLLGRLTDDERSGSGLTESQLLKTIYQNTGKQVNVSIHQTGPLSIAVNCDITYECSWPRNISVSYNVYHANYNLTEQRAADGSFEGYTGGNKIYIFARAWQEQGYGAADMPKYNKLSIVNDFVGAEKLEVCLVRGYYYRLNAGIPVDQRGLQFDEVSLDGSIYARMLSPGVLTGEYETARTILHTNIKGQMTGRQLMSADLTATVGMERAKVRSYEVTLTLTDRRDSTTAAEIVTTKEVRE